LLREVASALSLLHTRQLVHRDITSRNIRVCGEHAKLLDFGALAPIGYAGALVGTPPFVPPEALFCQPLDARSDLFSLGVVLYQTLSGLLPYRGRSWAEIQAAWQSEPDDIGVLVPDLPPELAKLTMSLIAPNRAARPHSASQVMEQLTHIAGLRASEPPGVARAYLVAPDLVARDAEIARVRAAFARARQRNGSGLIVTGPAGVGRTRFLDEAALEGRMAGAAVLNASAAAATDVPFATAQLLTQALLRTAPAAVARAARNDWSACKLLFRYAPDEIPATPSDDDFDHDVSGALSNFRELATQRPQAMAALRKLFSQVAVECDVMIVVDDLSRIDAPSAAWLGTLLALAASRRLLVVVSLADSERERLSAAHRLVVSSSQELRLGSFDAGQTGALIKSVFGAVPNVDPVAGSIFQLSQGLPRDAMALCEHLVETGVVRFRGANFFLPAKIDADDLPASMAATHARIVSSLSPDALRLGRALVLAPGGSLALPECIELSAHAGMSNAQLALDELAARCIVSGDGYRYQIANQGWARALSTHLEQAETQALHRALEQLSSSKSDRMLRSYHLLLGGLEADAVDLLLGFARELGDDSARLDVLSATRLRPKQVSTLLERMYVAAQRLNRPRHELGSLQHGRMMLGVYVDYAAFEEMRAIVVEDLKRDSGYLFWTAPDTPEGAIPAAVTAIQKAQAAFDATPPDQRMRAPVDAIRALVEFAAAGIAVGAQACNWELRRSLPDLLAPFACLMPVVAAIHENCLSVKELSFGRYERYRERSLSVLDRLAQIDIGTVPHGEEIRAAVIYGVASAEARIGMADALERLVVLEDHPRLRANAMDLKAYVLLQRGDWKGAAACNRLAEQMLMDMPTDQMFGAKFVRSDAEIYALGGDPGGIKRTIDRLETLCEQYRGWMPMLRLAQAEAAKLNGDHDDAMRAYDACLTLTEPLTTPEGAVPDWYWATAGRIEVLLEMGQPERAVDAGRRAMALGESWSSRIAEEVRFHRIVRALALAESHIGEHDVALARLQPAIAQLEQMGASGVYLGVLYEARALIALEKRDKELHELNTRLACDQFRLVEDSAFFTRARRLSERKSTPTSSASSAAFDGHTTLARSGPDPVLGRAVAELSRGNDLGERARRALSLLCQTRSAEHGHLFLLTREGFTLAASAAGPAASEDLVRFARRRLEAALEDADVATMAFPAGTTLSSPDQSSFESGGLSYSATVVSASAADGSDVVGIALLAGERESHTATFSRLLNTVAKTLIELGDVRAIRAA
jgi:hypothetical protein